MYVIAFAGHNETEHHLGQAQRAWTDHYHDITGVLVSAADAPELLAAVVALAETPPEQPWQLGFILVDPAGKCRGLYPPTPAGLDEVKHRAVHVLGEKRP